MGSRWLMVSSLPSTGDMSFITDARAWRTWSLGSITSCWRQGKTLSRVASRASADRSCGEVR